MENTRIAKVPNVTLCRRAQQVTGSLHITPHHLIFSHIPSKTSAQSHESPQSSSSQPPPTRPRELWITYPIISLCTLRLSPNTTTPSAATSTTTNSAATTPSNPPSIRLRCRDFAFICFFFPSDHHARAAFDSIRAFTCRGAHRIERLYAFHYRPQEPERSCNGWAVYDARRELEEMGIKEGMGVGIGHGQGYSGKWRISSVNKDYAFSPTYPALLAVPATISDTTLKHAARYRSRARIPVLTYLHPVNGCSITRSSQPKVGMRKSRSVQDEALVAAIFATTAANNPNDAIDAARDTPPLLPSDSPARTNTTTPPSPSPPVYGAQQHNLIVDARPTVNAYAMQAAGMGSESMDHYPFATKTYLGIDNIHVMRDSLSRVLDCLRDSDISSLPPNREALARSGWRRHVGAILDGAALVAEQVGVRHGHVLVHCSDGWDRTAQLCGVAQVMLEPRYRTLEGFMRLVEKEWCSFGHMFRTRGGLLGCEKWFVVENDRGGGGEDREDGMGGNGGAAGKVRGAANGAGEAIENAFSSARAFLNRDREKEKEKERERERERDRHAMQLEIATSLAPETERRTAAGTTSSGASTPRSSTTTPTPLPPLSEPEPTNPKETSPVFHQFLDAVYQLLYTHPTRFEFNERFLRRLLYHVHACQYGTFLFNSEREKVELQGMRRTRSVWDYFLARREMFVNPRWDGGGVDDKVRGRERLVLPVEKGEKGVRWWCEVFGREDAEMNGGDRERERVREKVRDGDAKRAGDAAVGPDGSRTPSLDQAQVTSSPTTPASTTATPPTATAAGLPGLPNMPGPIDIGATMSSGFAALAAGLSSLGFTGGKPQQQQSQQQQGTRKSHSQVPAKTLSQQHARKSEDTDTHTHTQHPRPSSRPPSRPASEVPSPPPLLAAPEKAHVKGEQLQQHTQRMEGEGEGDLFSPNDVRDPLADEVRELYAKIRQGKGSASPGGQKQDGTGEGKEEQRDDKQRNGSAQSHSQSGEGGRDEIAAPKQQPEIVPEREPGVDVDDSATATATGETVNPLLDPLLGEEAVDMTPRRRW